MRAGYVEAVKMNLIDTAKPGNNSIFIANA